MNIRHCALLLLALAVATVSCNKEKGEDEDSRGVKVSFTLTAPTVWEDPSGTWELNWGASDKISMFAFKQPSSAGLSASENTVNFTTNRFSAAGAGRKTDFSGYVPQLGKLGDGNQNLFIIYPAVNLTVSSQSYSADGGAFYKISGPTLPEKQDGTGWRYCRYVSFNGKISTTSREITAPPVFTLVNTLVKFRYSSGKAVNKIDIILDGPGLSGSYTLYSNSTSITEGCQGTTISLEKSGGELPEEVYFACGGIPKDHNLSVTFTTTDGETVSRAIKAEKDYVPGRLYVLPDFDLNEWISSEFASQAAKNMGMGINVGGLDTVTATTENLPDRADSEGNHRLDRNDPVTYETNAANDPITQRTMDVLHQTGFNSVRLPITWFNHMDNPTGPIDRVWLDHIKSRIDLARNADMYVVINIHHDAGTYDFCWLQANWGNYSMISTCLKNIWTQIAEYFKDYDHHLLFEGYNEIWDGKSWYAPSSADGFKAANALNQDFVDAVRATGGNNAVRNLIVSTYTSSERDEALDGFVLPKDKVNGHLMVQVHSYRPNEFVTARTVGDRSRVEFYESDKAEILEMFDRVQAKILNKGLPCFLGEYGAFQKKDAQGNRHDEDRGAHAYFYTTQALKRGVVPMYWYNPMAFRERDTGGWTYPILKDSLAKAWADYQAGKIK